MKGPNAAIAPRVVGRLRLAAPQRGYPKPTWRVVVHEARFAPVVAGLVGGSAATLDDGAVEIVTDAAEIEVLLDGPDAIRFDWYHGVRRCSTSEFADRPAPRKSLHASRPLVGARAACRWCGSGVSSQGHWTWASSSSSAAIGTSPRRRHVSPPPCGTIPTLSASP